MKSWCWFLVTGHLYSAEECERKRSRWLRGNKEVNRQPNKGWKESQDCVCPQPYFNDVLWKAYSHTLHVAASWSSIHGETPSEVLEGSRESLPLRLLWEHWCCLQTPFNLIAYSTDSARLSLGDAISLWHRPKKRSRKACFFLASVLMKRMLALSYYWYLPSIAYLNYDHEQTLFLKNLKCETHALTFGEQQGKTTCSAMIRHLQDLKQCCQVLGLDCGFNATDLLLIYFCDHNFDAYLRLFTPRITDLN